MSDEMAWEAIRLDRSLTPERVAEALAEVLGVDREDVDVGPRLEKLRPDAIVMAALREEEGDEPGLFGCVIDLVVKDDALTRPFDAVAVSLLCRAWCCGALIDDEGDNPYCFLRVSPSGETEAVIVDAAALDERNALVVRRPASEEERRAGPAGPVSQRRPTPPPPRSDPEP